MTKQVKYMTSELLKEGVALSYNENSRGNKKKTTTE